MNYFIVFILFLFALGFALISLSRQKRKIKEVDFVNRELKKKRVIFHHSSSSEESSR